jgi:hypothetical protein
MLGCIRWRTLPVALASVAVLCLGSASCHVRKLAVRSLPTSAVDTTISVTTPVKAHLVDGSTLHFPDGVSLTDGRLHGRGHRFGLHLELLGPMATLEMSLDSVVGLEVYELRTDVGPTAILTTLGLAAGVAGTAALAVAVFGSCPTFYSDSAGTWQLEAEGFSYSIAALFESRDVDRLRTGVRADGTVQLEVRNEALETHYINHLELLEIRHAVDELVLPDATGRPVVVGPQLPPLRVSDGSGMDLRATVARADGVATASDLDAGGPRNPADLEEHLDLTIAVPEGADSVALVLRLRNSLLNTVLLYDVVLGARGLRSLEWQSTDLREIGPALEVAQWYTGTMGLRVLEVLGDSTREVGRLRDTGPIAWKDVAVVLPAPRTPTMHLRLVTVRDNWRIDRIGSAPLRRPTVQHLSLDRALDAHGADDPDVLSAVAAPDGHYLQTVPGQRFTAVWQPAPLEGGGARTFLLASQGYYIEWMRRDWIAAPRDTARFRPTRETIAQAMDIWRTAKDSLERDFHASRLPVR